MIEVTSLPDPKRDGTQRLRNATMTERGHGWGHQIWFDKDDVMVVDGGREIPVKAHDVLRKMYIFHYLDNEIVSFCEYSPDKEELSTTYAIAKDKCPLCGHVNS